MAADLDGDGVDCHAKTDRGPLTEAFLCETQGVSEANEDYGRVGVLKA
jgi:hypothetical protein